MSSGMQEINPLDWAFDPLTEAIVEISSIKPHRCFDIYGGFSQQL